MRTRSAYSTSDFVVESSNRIFNANGTSTPRSTPVYFKWLVPQKLETLEYATDATKADARSNWNLFEHYKRSIWYNKAWGLSVFGSQLYTASGWDRCQMIPPSNLASTTVFGSQDYPTVGLPALYELKNGAIIKDVPDLANLIAWSLKSMLPEIRPELSLLNSIYELKDFKTLPATIRRLKPYSPKGKLSLRRILGGGSDSYLQSQFNLLPLLSDIAGIRNALKNAQKQVNQMLALEGKPLTRHYWRDLSAPYPNKDETSGSTYTQAQSTYWSNPNGATAMIIGTWRPRRVVTYEVQRFHAEIQYTYYLSGFDREHAYVKGLMDGLGVNLNPAIIWNAIPWSFVVDWVLGVSRWLNQFRVNNLEPRTVIHRYLWSTSVKRKIDIYSKMNVNATYVGSPEVLNTTVVEEAYKRFPRGISTTDITTSGVSAKEFLLMSALALSKLTRRPRHK